ncbi:taste receptor type 2 member 40-like [Phyllobates terribilis]|uniref:taste receptor type 2 member 40-like n=1 Tax=Phyllobates terribilis TaxID=111132 RepID=UPI003CCA8FA2
MGDLQPSVAVSLHALLALTGIMGNVFILIVHFLDWLKTYKLNPCDFIINSISLSNISLQGAVLINEIFYFLFITFYSQTKVFNSMVVIMFSFAFSSLWCSVVLCFYYCVKIINFTGTFFHMLKAKLAGLVPWMIIFSIVMSWAAGLPSYWDLYHVIDISFNPISNYTGNRTFMISFKLKSKCNCLFNVYVLLCAVALVIIVFTAGGILLSLCMHMIRMKHSNEGSGGGKINSHLSAAKTVTSLLLLYLYFIWALNMIINETTAIGSLTFSMCFLAISSFPTLNAIILIKGNRKLRNMCKRILGIKSVVAGNIEVIVATN